MCKALPLGDTRKRRQIFIDPVYMERKLSRVEGSPLDLPTSRAQIFPRARSASGKFMFSAAKARESWGQLTEPEMRSKGLLAHSPTRATLGEPTCLTLFPHKTWRSVYMRNKKLAWLGGWPFCHGRVTFLAGPFSPYKRFGLACWVNLIKAIQSAHARVLFVENQSIWSALSYAVNRVSFYS